MTIASALVALNTDIQNARTAITNKGGTVTANGGSSQLATDIATIPSGGGTSEKYGATIDAILGDVNANGVLQQPTEQSDLVFTGVKDVADYGLYYKFMFSEVKSVSFPDLEQISGNYGCNYAFQRCSLLTSVSLPKLTTISGSSACNSMLYGTALTSVSLPKLTTISGGSACSYMFAYCRNLTDVYFNSLTTSSFGSKTNQFNYMMNSTGNTTTHTLHFPSNLKSTISGLSGYPLFGGTSGYVVCAFDLPATN